MKQKTQEEGLDLANPEYVIPSGEKLVVPKDVERLGRILTPLHAPTVELLAKLSTNDADAYRLLQESVTLYQAAEHRLRLLLQTGSFIGVASLGRLVFRFERALSYFNSVMEGLVASGKSSTLDLIQVKHDLQLVWDVLQDVERLAAASRRVPFLGKVD